MCRIRAYPPARPRPRLGKREAVANRLRRGCKLTRPGRWCGHDCRLSQQSGRFRRSARLLCQRGRRRGSGGCAGKPVRGGRAEAGGADADDDARRKQRTGTARCSAGPRWARGAGCAGPAPADLGRARRGAGCFGAPTGHRGSVPGRAAPA
ncbi:MAG: hypothetical protein E5W21_25810, partial [Mesorhizobium sp.]